ncbi:hypothetical protein [Mesonia sp.]|uniref:hypothetical protein n=1 Tax=Mesonia sp. TaxID=1960830 RepID=UPI003F9A0FB5
MPVNLNALLRYRTIDSCLRNKYHKCDIEHLIEKCSEAITETTGKKTSISERSIRNDIRVLRSEILGFNAPIICEDGIYYYSEPEFSIFQSPVKDKELLIEVQEILLEQFDNIPNKKLPYLLMALSKITKVDVPKKYFPPDHNIYSKRSPNYVPSESDIFKKRLNNSVLDYNRNKRERPKTTWIKSLFKKKSKPASFPWNYILETIT